VSTVVVRMPDGSRLPPRRFKESDKVAHVYAYVTISMLEKGNTDAFELIVNMPLRALKEHDTSLADAQLQGQVLLICQPTA
jgi:6,7-dimethyl-8-ribityllumazine synthase